MKEFFLLDPNIIFLNHGSFGATPRPVFERYQAWQLELERQPVEFIGRRSKDLLHQSRETLAGFFHTKPDNLVYMTNVTVALNAVARGLSLSVEDEVLASNQEYGALDKTWRFLAQKEGFKYINTPIDLPVTTQEKYIEDLWRGVTPKTRVIFISHISSSTSVIAPIQEICQRARRQGIMTIIDGAHVAGHIPLDLEDLGADIYGGNLHKWLCAPKGSGFLYAAPRVHHLLEPLVVSFGWESDASSGSRVVDLYEYIGTRDIAAFLSVPEAIKFQADHNWPQVRSQMHALASQCQIEICRLTGLEPLYSPTSNWFAQMVNIPLPVGIDLNHLKNTLYDEFHIEVPVGSWNGKPMIRVSFQAYNSQNDLDALCFALQSCFKRA
jgi:isopenicillin-N epimerase